MAPADDAAATPDATMREVDAVANDAAVPPDANDATMQADAAADGAAAEAPRRRRGWMFHRRRAGRRTPGN